jgi:hypothetical protein
LLNPTIHLFSFCPFRMVMFIVAPKAPYSHPSLQLVLGATGLPSFISCSWTTPPPDLHRNRNRAAGKNSPLPHRSLPTPDPNPIISLMMMVSFPIAPKGGVLKLCSIPGEAPGYQWRLIRKL